MDEKPPPYSAEGGPTDLQYPAAGNPPYPPTANPPYPATGNTPYPPQAAPYQQPLPQTNQYVHSNVNVVQAQPAAIILTANCPNCRSGILVEEFTCCGICLGIFCFPIGLICCLLMKDKRCTNCRATF